jgi:hypothetical protein
VAVAVVVIDRLREARQQQVPVLAPVRVRVDTPAVSMFDGQLGHSTSPSWRSRVRLSSTTALTEASLPSSTPNT